MTKKLFLAAALVALMTTAVSALQQSPRPPPSSSKILPEISTEHQAAVQSILDSFYGSVNDDVNDDIESTSNLPSWTDRRTSAIDASESDGLSLNLEQHMTVYGELGIDALVTVMEAVGVKSGDSFLDIGSGDGMLVMGAALLWGEHQNGEGTPGLRVSRGVEILPTLYERSLRYQAAVQKEVASQPAKSLPMTETELCLGNALEHSSKELGQVFQDTTLAVCFATTWSRGQPGRRLPELSKAVGRDGVSELPKGARLVIIDGVLDPKDGFAYEGQLKLYCKDTAPYSIARLYTRI